MPLHVFLEFESEELIERIRTAQQENKIDENLKKLSSDLLGASIEDF